MRNFDNFCKKVLFGFFFCFHLFLYGEVDVFFSPKDNVSSKLLDCINGAQNRIYAAVYMITDIRIARALIEAQNERNVDVQIVTDKISVESESGKIDFLKENGIQVFVFKPPIKKNKKYEKKMHHKFALFDKKAWTGSYNWTLSADKRNTENVICIDDIQVCKRYEKEFDALKRNCIKTKISSQNNKNRKYQTKLFHKKGVSTDQKAQDKNLKEKILELFRQIKMKFANGIQTLKNG